MQHATWQENQQLAALVKQQSARLQQQSAELDVLRGMAAVQNAAHQHHPQPGPARLSGSGRPDDVQLQQQLAWQRAVSWLHHQVWEPRSQLLAQIKNAFSRRWPTQPCSSICHQFIARHALGC